MAGLDYFLDKKWIRKDNKSLNNEQYQVSSFSTINQRINFSLEERLKNDRYLFDYAKAFSAGEHFLVRKEVQLLEILSLLLLDGDLKETNPKKIFKVLVEIKSGKKPKTQDERKIWNLLEVLDLIATEKFEINEDNYELVTHIMFRNLGYNLDVKREFYREKKTKTHFKHLLDPTLIDEELNSLLSYIANLDKNAISGITQTLVILFSYLYVSPYKKNNVILAFVMSKWYLYGLEGKMMLPNPIYNIALHWNHFVKVVDETFASDLNIDKPAELLFRWSLWGINMRYRLDALEDWIYEDWHLNQHLFGDVLDKTLLVSLLKFKSESWKLSQVMPLFKLVDNYLFSKRELSDALQRFVDNQILTQEVVDEVEVYKLNNRKLEKVSLLLTDE